MESYRLGLGDPIPFSAEHGEGLSDLFEALLPFEAVSADTIVDLSDETAAVEFGNEDDPTAAIQLAIIGRPNVGKSTLVNRLLGENRMLTGPEAGITRDSISIAWEYKGRPFRLVDTAGLRRRSRVTQKLEYLSTADTQRAIRYAQVVVLVIDATQGLERQDLTIARQATDEGRALVLAVNKWDLVEDRATTMGAIRDRLQTSLPQVRGVSVVTFSALTGRSISSLLPSVMKTYEIWNTRIPTGELNRWLAALTQHHPPPMAKGRRIRLRYMTQAKARPPTFVIFINQPEELAVSYLRYLTNGLRDDFGLDGVPIRILTRRGKNPYVDP
jgi:GTP-binding protein